jgi:hypothetical protein
MVPVRGDHRRVRQYRRRRAAVADLDQHATVLQRHP